jgi:hypothetical protein
VSRNVRRGLKKDEGSIREMKNRKRNKIMQGVRNIVKEFDLKPHIGFLLSFMSKREREVFSLLHGIGGDEPKDYEEIENLLHLRLEHVKKIESKGFRQLRNSADVHALKRWIDKLPVFDKEAMLEDQGEELAILRFDIPIILDSRNIGRRLIFHFSENPDRLFDIDPEEFERLIANVWFQFGYEVELTSKTRDGGRDIIAIKHAESSVRYLIECKRYSAERKVGIVPVRALYGVKTDEKATKAILATTSGFSREALEFFERHRWELEGRDFNGIVDWLKIAKKYS